MSIVIGRKNGKILIPIGRQCDFVAPHIKVKCTSPDFESRLGHVACFGHVTQTEVLKSASALAFALSFTVLWNLESTMQGSPG